MRQTFRTSLAAVVAVAAAASGAVAGTAEAFERRGDQKILVTVQRQAVPIMDPSIKYDASIRTMQQAMYDALLKYVDTPPRVVPWLAERYDMSEDGLTYTFHLVENARFHNGDPVDAEAVRWSFERTLELGKGPAWMLNAFLKAENVRAADARTVVFTLDRPFAPFISFLPWWYVMNPKEVMAHEVDGDMGQKWLIDHEAGSGPYKLRRVEHGTLYELERVQDYWKGHKGPLGGIIYKLVRESAAQRAALLKGEAEPRHGLESGRVRPAGQGAGHGELDRARADRLRHQVQHPGREDLGREPPQGRRLRLRLRRPGEDLQRSGGPPDQPVQRRHPGQDHGAEHAAPSTLPRRRSISRSRGGRTAASSWSTSYVQGLEEERLMGLVLIDNLKELDITVKMVPLTWANMVARGSKVETSPDMMAIFATPVSTDPDAVAIQYHPSSHGRYYGVHFYDNPEVTKLIEEARFTGEWEKRAPLYAKIQQMLVDDQPEIFGMMRERRIVYRDWVKGFEYSPVRMTEETDFYPLYIE